MVHHHRVNENHAVCGGEEWRAAVRDWIIPWALADGDLGDDVLEVGPGYGATTDVFREQVAHLTAVEIDPVLARALADRLAGTNVDVIEADATALALGDNRFTGAVCFSMLHHVAPVDLQDRLFAEVARVTRPGGLFVASDALRTDELEACHIGDTYLPIDPDSIGERLERAGFGRVEVRTNKFGWAASGRVTASR